MLQIGVGDGGDGAFSEVEVVQAEDAGVGSEAEFVRAVAPGEVVVDEEAGGAAALHPGVVEAAEGREGIRAAALEDDGESGESLLEIGGAEEAFVPGEGGIEVVDEVLREDVRVARGEGVERLRGDGVEQGIDGIGPGGLQAGVGLEAEPGGVLRIDVVVEADGLHLLVVVAGVRDTLTVRAAVTAGERAAEHRDGRSRGAAVEREHLAVERDGRRRDLLQDVLLKRCAGHDGRRDDGQRDAHPLAVEEEKELVVEDGAADAAAEVVHRGAGLAIAGRGVGEVVGGVEDGAVPQLVEVAVELICA